MKMKILFSVILFFALLPLSAQTTYRPKSFVFEGAPNYTHEELLNAAQLKDGEAYTGPQLNEHAQLLVDTGLFDNLDFKFVGYDILFHLTPSKTLYALRLQNVPALAGVDYDAELKARIPLYRGLVPTEGGLLNTARTTIMDILKAHGVQAFLEANPYTDPKAHEVTAMSLTITAPDVRIGAIRVAQASGAAQSDPKINEILARIAGGAFQTHSTQTQIEESVAVYLREKGYLEAEAHATPDAAPQITPQAIVVPYQLTVQTGDLYLLSGIHLAPGLLVSQEDFDKQAKLKAGDAADGAHVRNNWTYLTLQYHSKGYMKASIDAKPTLDKSAHTVSYTVNVDPGPVFTMGKLTVGNVAEDLHNAMLAAWKMPARMVFNERAILNYFTLQEPSSPLGQVFNRPGVNCKYTLVLNEEDHTVDVTLRLEKK